MTAAAKPQEQRISARQATAVATLTIVTSVASAHGDNDAVEAPETSVSRRLTTPKMKWMLRWSQQQQQEKETQAEEAGDKAEVNATHAQAQSLPQEKTEPEAPAAEDAESSHVADAAPATPDTTATTGTQENRDPTTEDGEVVADVQRTELKTESRRAADEQVVASSSSGELRVTMPPAVESSSLSPPMERASPTAASTSISPSAKLKEVDGVVVVRSRTPSPTMMLLDETTPEASHVSTKAPVKPTLSSLQCGAEGSAEELQNDPVPLERLPIKRKPQETQETPTAGQETVVDPTAHLSESERQRLERRKRRKSNWDVGDPRKHGGSIDLAALNLLSSTSTPATHPASFAKFPRQRAAYRQSQSLEVKEHPPFQRRASFGSHSSPPAGSLPPAVAASFAQSPPAIASLPPVAPSVPRRAFNHSNSMPPPSSRPGSSRFSTNGGYR